MTTQNEEPPGTKAKSAGLILVVDDEPIMRKIAINVLHNSGYTIMAAEDGDKALNIFKKHYKEIKLVVLDLLMPIKDGKETYIEMKEIDPNVRVLLVSGIERNNRIEELLKLGVNAYLEKPYTFPQLSHLALDIINQSIDIKKS